MFFLEELQHTFEIEASQLNIAPFLHASQHLGGKKKS